VIKCLFDGGKNHGSRRFSSNINDSKLVNKQLKAWLKINIRQGEEHDKLQKIGLAP
jgi:hypothetical protein